jgi:membrane protein DedA with SNARE-associated domain
MKELLLHLGIASSPLTYIVIFLGMAVEGDAFLIFVSILARQGLFHLVPAVILSIGGIIVGDFLWYLSGRYAYAKFPEFWKRRVQRFSKRFDFLLERHPSKTFFVSKFIYGLHHILLIRGGMMDIKPKKIFYVDAFTSVLWFVLIGGAGYFLSESLVHKLRALEVVILIFVLGFIVFDSVLSDILRRILKKETEDDA